MQILIGDIGGTRVRLRLLESTAGGWQLRHESIRKSREFDNLEGALRSFLDELSRSERANVHEAWLAVAGPVSRGQVRFTNLPWESGEHLLETALKLRRVRLVNDLEALAHALPDIPRRQLIPIQEGHADSGPRLLISVGTGLGLASWHEETDRIRVWPSEGGHSDFASQSSEQHALWKMLAKHHGHVSYERLLSGPGLNQIYEFTCRRQAYRPFDGHINKEDRTPLICQRAESRQDESAQAAIRLFTEVLGSFAGNAALFHLATGGVYLAGGVVTGLRSWLNTDKFTESFCNKGRLHSVLANIPVQIITVDEPGLEGITLLATRHSQNT